MRSSLSADWKTLVQGDLCAYCLPCIQVHSLRVLTHRESLCALDTMQLLSAIT